MKKEFLNIMDISALDLVTLREGTTPEEAYKETIDLAKHLDEWGYKRLWFAEHHGTSTQASSSPETLAAYVSAVTNQIHVGTGGTMIMHYSPLKIAENFKTMATLAPGRVDLGIGRAPGGSGAAITALSQGSQFIPSQLYDKAQTVLDYISENPRKEEIYSKIDATPQDVPELPEAWMLGSSGNSAIQTASMGLGYNFAKFFGVPDTSPQIFKAYREHFKPSPFLDKPKAMSTYEVVVAETKEKADYIAKPLEVAKFLMQYGRIEKTMSPEKAKDIEVTAPMADYIEGQYNQRFMIKGTPKEVADILKDEQDKYGLDEVMLYTPLFDYQDRLDSYKLIKEEFDK